LKIHFTPGERFSYSGEGFVYLGAVIERITGETAEAFVSRRVFAPLGMRSSSLVWQVRYEPLKVFGHGPIGNVTGRNMPWKSNPAASLHTTAQDYARFVAAAIAGVGLRPETARQMLSPQARLDEAGFNTATVPPTGRLAASLAWGLGWGLEEDDQGWSVWHWGDNGPAKAYVVASPLQRSGFVVFLNSQNGLAMMATLMRELRGTPSPAFAWLKIQEPVPALASFVRTMREQGVARALDAYRASRRPGAVDAPLSESAVNSIGYALLRDQKAQDAILVFEMNAEDHPQSWNVHDSLGEALAAADDTARAVKAYERSVELNPGNANGIAALKKLRERAGKG
jgi:CubicO group peptidase (beta-lactamase class C family)